MRAYEKLIIKDLKKVQKELDDFIVHIGLFGSIRNKSVSHVNDIDVLILYHKITFIELKDKTEKLHKAKQTAINGIEELGKMTPELMENILKAKTLKEVEEIYKPYKSKKKTKAMIAIEK